MPRGHNRRYIGAIVEQLGGPSGVEAGVWNGGEHVGANEAHGLDGVAKSESIAEERGETGIVELVREEVGVLGFASLARAW